MESGIIDGLRLFAGERRVASELGRIKDDAKGYFPLGLKLICRHNQFVGKVPARL